MSGTSLFSRSPVRVEAQKSQGNKDVSKSKLPAPLKNKAKSLEDIKFEADSLERAKAFVKAYQEKKDDITSAQHKYKSFPKVSDLAPDTTVVGLCSERNPDFNEQTKSNLIQECYKSGTLSYILLSTWLLQVINLRGKNLQMNEEKVAFTAEIIEARMDRHEERARDSEKITLDRNLELCDSLIQKGLNLTKARVKAPHAYYNTPGDTPTKGDAKAIQARHKLPPVDLTAYLQAQTPPKNTTSMQVTLMDWGFLKDNDLFREKLALVRKKIDLHKDDYWALLKTVTKELGTEMVTSYLYIEEEWAGWLVLAELANIQGRRFALTYPIGTDHAKASFLIFAEFTRLFAGDFDHASFMVADCAEQFQNDKKFEGVAELNTTRRAVLKNAGFIDAPVKVLPPFILPPAARDAVEDESNAYGGQFFSVKKSVTLPAPEVPVIAPIVDVPVCA